MSLAINVDKVQRVLLTDGWHAVRERSFTLDAYEFVWEGRTMHGGGESGVSATGFQFKTDDGILAGPLTAVLAVDHLP